MKKAYQGLIKTLGRGAKGSRSLTLSEAHFLIRGFSDGIGTKVQLAAALMLMRVRGETCEEVAGAALGIKSTMSAQWSNLDVSIDWPCYAGKRELLPWLLLAAKVLASQGERVLLHGDPKSLSHRNHIAAHVEGLNIPKASNPDEAKAALDAVGICYVDADSFSPLVAQFRELHQELGLRSLFQIAIRCTNPANAPISLRSYFHPGLDKMHGKVAKLMACACLDARLPDDPYNDNLHRNFDNHFDNKLDHSMDSTAVNPAEQAFALKGRVGIFKGVQGETEINPRISTELTIATGDTSQVIYLPTRLEGFVGMNTLSSELALSPQQACLVLSQIWHHGEASDTRHESHSAFSSSASSKLGQIAEASVISTLSAIYLLQGKCQSVSQAQSLAIQAWRMR
ncbi:glycosyl transferase [Shewanella violacea]|uniref:Glycosyl transferase, group 3 domain protein n=1 Tax=Shewanella violacea (strain JCM 10179 / CIP 106290 / LMG 19151 / DSS12) TaxID=637905 RepID=D4ZLX3_SHEVD|nr:glycosyl transferase [Shewanella violacea]BAJ02672.1 glycosyl transferase, group 3 domain protein [Shewanella violacea DSS12]